MGQSEAGDMPRAHGMIKVGLSKVYNLNYRIFKLNYRIYVFYRVFHTNLYTLGKTKL